MIKKIIVSSLLLFICMVTPALLCAQAIKINHNTTDHYLVFGNEKMQLKLDYNGKVTVSELRINQQDVMKTGDGIYSAIRTKNAAYSTLSVLAKPRISINGHSITVTGIGYGDTDLRITEDWTFVVTANSIQWKIDRSLSKTTIAEQIAFPAFMFNSINTWEGAYQGYGGLAWFYLFSQPQDTYGVHSNVSEFWNQQTGNGLTIAVAAAGKQVAMDYSRTVDNKLLCTVALDEKEMQLRYDSGTQRRRFIRGANNEWAPVTLRAGKTSQTITLTAFNCHERYDRGTLAGINAKQVGAVLNTIARIGVIDKEHFGGNSWHTPYGPICLHEQYIAQMGLGINDPHYTAGYRQCLDFYRDHAVKPDGRVWPRWAYTNEDMMPGQVNSEGFYEAQWGYLLDANTDFVTNVAELYDQLGDLAWVKQHQRSCEQALEWIMKRDSNGNGLVEMMTDSHQQQRGSDWIDIIWASYENALVNAKLYRALVLWAGIEQQLGNTPKATWYQQFAGKLRNSFNKPVAAGGFWDEQKQCYIYWRDKDGSPHGSNMVTPVNFMAIAYGICEDTTRRIAILEGIETQMQKEKLFFWPLCLYSFAPGEGRETQYPFPEYENGDIFLSWGAVAVQAYASYKPALALKYVKNVLAQYEKDGLAFQRYGRALQDGRGDDILSGNSLSIVGLYQAIYGVNPRYNRFYLNPHITPELAGTQLYYNFHQQRLIIHLDTGSYKVSDGNKSITAKADFGFFSTPTSLSYFNGNADTAAITVSGIPAVPFQMEIKACGQQQVAWRQSMQSTAAKRITYRLAGLKANQAYQVLIDGRIAARAKASASGALTFNYATQKNSEDVVVLGAHP